MNKLLEQQVRDRAGAICEYCRVPASLYDQPFHIDHIISRKHDGKTELDNLAFSCLDRNAHKGTDVAGIDAETGQVVRLFNPRTDRWTEHFAWNGPLIVGRTPSGRVTVRLAQPTAARSGTCGADGRRHVSGRLISGSTASAN